MKRHEKIGTETLGLIEPLSWRVAIGHMHHILRILVLLKNILKTRSPFCIFLFSLVSAMDWLLNAPTDVTIRIE